MRLLGAWYLAREEALWMLAGAPSSTHVITRSHSNCELWENTLNFDRIAGNPGIQTGAINVYNYRIVQNM